MGHDQHGLAYPDGPTPPNGRRCLECERRHVEMRLMVAATAQWAAKPFGQSVRAIYLDLLAEAKATGEWPSE